jgi:hypothetical protein
MNVLNVSVQITKTMRMTRTVNDSGAYLFANELQLCFFGDVDTQLDTISILKIELEKLQDEILRAAGREAA